VPNRNIKHPERAHAEPTNDQSEEHARYEVTERLKWLQRQVLDRRIKGHKWSTILTWLLSTGGIC